MKGQSWMHPLLFPVLRRILYLSLASVVLVLMVSEVAYRLLREDSSRAPQTINLLIPSGTAERVALGESEPSIPEDMIFVVGDILLVKNEDIVDHQLGPLWIPAGKTATLLMGEVINYAYTCSFRPSNYLGVNVREPVTWTSRLGAVVLASPPTTIFLFVYSLVMCPVKSSRVSVPTGHQVEGV